MSLMPLNASIAIADMLENCAELQPGQRVLILANIDGLHGGNNLIDEEVIHWIQAGVQSRGAYASVLWVDEPFEPYNWRIPPVVTAALAGVDVLINNSFDLTTEEMRELRDALVANNVNMVRNFATTTALMTSAYALTPHELVCEIRYRVGAMFTEGANWQITDPNGTHLAGKIGKPMPIMPWTQWRRDTNYRPFPEWVHPPVSILEAEGELVFDRSLSWWTRYVGLPPFFSHPVRVSVEQGRIKRFQGSDEADTLNSFFRWLADKYGEDVCKLSLAHSGVHPNAVPPAAVTDPLYRRLIEHQHTCNIHFHLGDIMQNPEWPAYMLHLTADIRRPTWQVGETLVHKDGHLMALDLPEVLAIASRYPARPGLSTEPWAR